MNSYEGEKVENLPLFDPIWLKYGFKIRALARTIGPWSGEAGSEMTGPQTKAGKKLVELEAETLLFKYYRRLIPIYGALIALVESELVEIVDNETQDEIPPKKYFFDEPINQRIVLRAFGLVIEKAIKLPRSASDPSCYEEYRGFFEEMEGSLILRTNEDECCQPSLDFRIETAYRPHDFLAEMAGIFSDCVNTHIQRSKRALAFSMNDLSVNIYEMRKEITGEIRGLDQNQRQEMMSSLKKTQI